MLIFEAPHSGDRQLSFAHVGKVSVVSVLVPPRSHFDGPHTISQLNSSAPSGVTMRRPVAYGASVRA